MTSLILQTASRALQPLMLFVSLVLLLRGHDEPGGGFVGGLLGGAAFGLHSLAFGVRSARASLRVDPRGLVAAGLVLAVAVAVLPLALGKPLLTSLWVTTPWLGDEVELGSPLAFDAGVYLIVAGVALSSLFALEEEE